MYRDSDQGGGRWLVAKVRAFRGLQSRWDSHPMGMKFKQGEGKSLTSIYFYEFPNRIKVVDIYELFGCNGEIMEVAISP